ncbi:hypothetical protein HI914_05060 [Erysiphe necator]|nr:hypothetical protein HI914_05060 [Erysiphe necator]
MHPQNFRHRGKSLLLETSMLLCILFSSSKRGGKSREFFIIKIDWNFLKIPLYTTEIFEGEIKN